MLAKLLTLPKRAESSPVLYFLKKEAGRFKTFIIVASWTDFWIFIMIRELK